MSEAENEEILQDNQASTVMENNVNTIIKTICTHSLTISPNHSYIKYFQAITTCTIISGNDF